MKTAKLKVYEAPKAEVIAIEAQGVLCASGGDASFSTGGGRTNSMGINNSFGW